MASTAGLTMRVAGTAMAGEVLAETLLEVADSLVDGIMLLDSECRIYYANQASRQMSRITPEMFNSKSLWELFPEMQGSAVEAAYREAISAREERRVAEYYYEPFDIWMDVHVLPTQTGAALHYCDVTQVHKAERARDELSEQLEQVFDATTDGIACIDRDWCVSFINRAAREILSPHDDLLGRNIWEAFPASAAEGAPYREQYGRSMFEGLPSAFEAFYPEPFNLWLKIESYPSREGMIVFFRDITEEKQREDALRASEARYRVLTELSPQAQWVATPEGRLIYANRRFMEFAGSDFSPTSGKDYIECFDPADRQAVVERWRECLRTGEDFDIEARLLRASDGASRWCRLKASPVRNEHGAIEQWLGVATDIHEARLAEKRLRLQYEQLDKQSRMLEAIYAGSPIAMVLYEPKELRILNLNERQAEILGVAQEEALGRRVDELLPDETVRLEMLRRAAQGEAVLDQVVEGTLPLHPNEFRYWNVNYSPIFAEDGSVTAIAGATVDITQQKRAEAALIQTEKLAAVGRLASSISHEINNPLEAIMNLLYLVSGEDLGGSAREYVSLAQEELRRVSQIATQTLRFHRQSTAPVDADPAKMLDTVLHLYQGRLSNSGIALERRYRPTGRVHCFESDIRQVLHNLIANGIDAMRGRGGRLIVSTSTMIAKDGKSGVAITVADTGLGMSIRTRERLFEPFFTTKGLNGTGLGLWISKSIAERHHGRLKVRSKEGVGTVFQLLLPCETGVEASGRSATHSENR